MVREAIGGLEGTVGTAERVILSLGLQYVDVAVDCDLELLALLLLFLEYWDYRHALLPCFM